MRTHKHHSIVISRKTLSSFPKIYLNIMLLFFFNLFTNDIKAQRENNTSDFNNVVASTNFIENIIIIPNTGKVYVNWLVKGEVNDGVYLIERSMDGFRFNPIGFKEVVSSDMELLYSWVDSEPVEGAAYYRLSKVGEMQNQEVLTASIPVINLFDNSESRVATRIRKQ
jgi:hypothetical protein